MSKLVVIGGGSTIFVRTLVSDLLTFKEDLIDTISLVDINKEKLDLMANLTQKMCRQQGKQIRIEATTERREVLKGAKYVVCTIDVGGADTYAKDLEIPDKYGLNQNIGDTLGPGGVFRALRIVPEILDICKDIEELCPDALFFNYSNPMCIVYMALKMRTKIEAYGLCHCVQGTAEQLSQYLQVPSSSLTYLCAGINHMGWFLEIKVDGKDAYPVLREKSNSLEKIEHLSNLEKNYSDFGVKLVDIVRFEVMNHFGYFTCESPFHLSEYLPYFRKSLDLIRKYKVEDRWWLEHKQSIDNIYEDIKDILKSNEPVKIEKSNEYFPDIVYALEKNRVFRPNINVLNTGLIPNLPYNCCVEVPCVVDGSGIHPCYIGNLPEQCAALNRTNINVQIMAAKAAVEKDKVKKKQYVMQAIKLDPLTSSILTLDQTTNMVEELIEANREYLDL